MIIESSLSTIINSQNEVFQHKKTGLKRNVLAELSVTESFALIVTGVRRCGKSTLLYQLLQEKPSKALFLNFEDVRLAGFETDDFTRLINEINKRKPEILFFDEIQQLEKWELFVRQLLDEGYKIAITGSNATLLSKELGTKLTGRHLSTELFPFSYAEFLAFKNFGNNEASFSDYLYKGGFPEYLKTDNGSILNQLLDDILNRDIAVRYNVRDISVLRQLAVYLISNIGKPVSGNKLKEIFNIKSATTILELFSHLENAYIVQFLPKFSYSLKTQIRNAKKVYAIDLGLFSQTSIVFSDEKGRRLENLIYLHLRRKTQEIYYFQEKKECDFVIIEKGKAKELIQVCFELNEENLSRETTGLMEAMNFFELSEGKIITYNQTDTFKQNGKTIFVIPAFEFINL